MHMKSALVACVVACAIGAGCSSDPQAASRKYLESGNRYFDKKQYKEAILEYRNALQKDPRSGPAHLKLAESYARIKDFGNAGGEYIRAADALPDDTAVQLQAGTWLLAMGKPVPEGRGKPGCRWVRLSTDVPTSVAEIAAGRLALRPYLRSLKPHVEGPIAAWDDPLPIAAELWLIASRLGGLALGRRTGDVA